MGEFFKGWRRKTGVLTLVMACLFAAVWVRSMYQRDYQFVSGAHLLSSKGVREIYVSIQ